MTIVRPVIAPVTQPWGANKSAANDWQGHPGVDYGSPMGARVNCPIDGSRIILAGVNVDGGFGYHPVAGYNPFFNLTWLVGHMETHCVNVGDIVNADQMIGLCDTEGWATGPHVHFEMRPGDNMYGGNGGPNPNFDPDAWLHFMGAYNDVEHVSPPGQLSTLDRQTIRETQTALQMPQDGGWGSAVEKNLRFIEAKRLTPPNPVVRSTQIAMLQKAWGFAPQDQDGIWGPQTSAAFHILSYSYYNK